MALTDKDKKIEAPPKPTEDEKNEVARVKAKAIAASKREGAPLPE